MEDPADPPACPNSSTCSYRMQPWTPPAKPSAITRQTMLPLGLVAIVIVFLGGAAWQVRGYIAESETQNVAREARISAALADQAAAFAQLSRDITLAVEDLTDELDRRTRSRWTYDMENDSWIEWTRANPHGIAPDIRAIKRDRDDLETGG